MNKANLKSYAPKARLDFIKAVTERANVLGISAAGVVPAEVRGDVALIDGREWPAKVAGQRDELIARIKRHGFEQTMDEVAYTWFNRFAALRYMEIHDYLGHGWRVLSSHDGSLPEILRHASEVTLPGLNADRAREMQLAGNQDNELYKLLLVAQCNELSRVMPFLFERIDDETELLLPENLLRTDSIVAKLVESVPEEDWQKIEVIGWLYQFYISDKKDQVMGKVVKSEDIPAATQLFTPNWIVQYLVQNSVGRLWLMANPTSTLASQWPYYIQPAEQTPEVQAQMDALIQTRIREDGETLNPETITVLDPACGSGHILVVAYDVLKAIYLERGYQLRAIPRLILEQNLYGLDIDDRAGQLAAFALLMKARADDRRLFIDPPKLNVLSLRESKGLDVDELANHLALYGVQHAPLKALLDIFDQAKTLGSLIQIPVVLSPQLATMADSLQLALREGDLYAQQAAKDTLPLIWQALILGMLFDAVLANPPYMGSKGMNGGLKELARTQFPDSKSDLFAVFIDRGFQWCRPSGTHGMITMQSWMFLSSFQNLRERILRERTIISMAHLGPRAFAEIAGEVVQTTASVMIGCHADSFRPTFIRLINGNENDKASDLISGRSRSSSALQSDFNKIPGSPIAYWVSDTVRLAFVNGTPLHEMALPRAGMITGNNATFVRMWYEVSSDRFGSGYQSRSAAKGSGRKWFPYQKGGIFRKWHGNLDAVVDWEDDGLRLRTTTDSMGKVPAHAFNEEYIFQPNVNWSAITTSYFSVRISEGGALFDAGGSAAFPSIDNIPLIASFLNSKVAHLFLGALNPTVNFQAWNIGNLPILQTAVQQCPELTEIVNEARAVARLDWDASEVSWDFKIQKFLDYQIPEARLSTIFDLLVSSAELRISKMKGLEERSNKIFIDSYGLQDELSPEVPEDQITLTRADREKDCQRLVSYAIGCMMGRYSLDEPGLIYAHAGNVGFDASRYEKKFSADADGILPITDERWFEDDAGSRMREFLGAVWGSHTLQENVAWLAESLGTKGSETPDETIRRYLADKFFKDHLQTYKRRPIYWLFSSGKQGGFQALVYLHRFNEGTLARMRAEYVVPLIAKVVSRLDMLDKDVAAASSAAARTKLQKQIESLRKKQMELLAYDEKLRHYADMRITLDLDDGVKANYAKFGDLVAESKAITGGSDE